MEKCPFCAGDIEDDVLKCKHCGEWLDDEHREEEAKVKNAQKKTGTAASFVGWLIAVPILVTILVNFISIFAKGCN